MPMIIQCPFFKRNEYLRLSCECAAVKFPDREARKEYLQNFCADPINWRRCTLAHCMENYYDRKEEE